MSFDWVGKEMRENYRVSGIDWEGKQSGVGEKRPQQKAGTKLVGQRMQGVKHTNMWKPVRDRSLKKEGRSGKEEETR